MASWKRVITTSDDSNYKNSNIQEATSSARGGVKIGYTESGKNYPVELDNGQMYVNVPWSDTNTNTFRTIDVTDGSNSSTLAASETLELKAGNNVSLTEADGLVTISATDTNTDTNTFRTVQVDTSGDGNVNNTLGSTETLRFKKGSNITLAESGGIITISATDTNTNTFRTIDVTDGSNSSTLGATETLELKAGNNVSLTEADGLVTISATDTNTDTNTNQLTTFQVEDGDGTEVTISHNKEWKFVEGGGININWSDTSHGSDTDPYDLSFNVDATVVRTTGTQTIGGDKTFSGDITFSGNTTTVNTETINLADNVIKINSNEDGTPSQSGGMEIERGTRTNTYLQWNEGDLQWEARVQGSSSNDTTGYVGRVALIEIDGVNAKVNGSLAQTGAMYINSGTGSIYIYS